MKLNNIAKGIALVASLTAAGSAMAASDGSLGADSTGTSDISLEIVDRVQISNMKDITIPAYNGTGDLTPDTTFCVYRNGGDDYRVTLTTDTTGFQLESGSTGDAVPFTAKVDDDLDATDGEAVTDASPSQVALTGSVATELRRLGQCLNRAEHDGGRPPGGDERQRLPVDHDRPRRADLTTSHSPTRSRERLAGPWVNFGWPFFLGGRMAQACFARAEGSRR
ncbi:MAG: hypothetical protein U5O39_09620 [Gammaproteobacteria bacterium]|nr:hypothetical protein [Gammaproteobacteria bacterium]